MRSHSPNNGKYHRYHIDTAEALEIVPWPSRFKVNVSRPKLAKYLISEIIHYRGDKEIILSRPCMYGVFSGPVGGFAPRENLCVGCLRCTTEFPDMVEHLEAAIDEWDQQLVEPMWPARRSTLDIVDGQTIQLYF